MSDKGKKRGGGLGKNAFFRQQEEDSEESVATPAKQDAKAKPKAPKPEKPKKVRTTVMLYPDTMAGLESLKAHGRQTTGKLTTYSDVLNEAIHDLMKKKGLI